MSSSVPTSRVVAVEVVANSAAVSVSVPGAHESETKYTVLVVVCARNKTVTTVAEGTEGSCHSTRDEFSSKYTNDPDLGR